MREIRNKVISLEDDTVVVLYDKKMRYYDLEDMCISQSRNYIACSIRGQCDIDERHKHYMYRSYLDRYKKYINETICGFVTLDEFCKWAVRYRESKRERRRSAKQLYAKLSERGYKFKHARVALLPKHYW